MRKWNLLHIFKVGGYLWTLFICPASPCHAHLIGVRVPQLLTICRWFFEGALSAPHWQPLETASLEAVLRLGFTRGFAKTVTNVSARDCWKSFSEQVEDPWYLSEKPEWCAGFSLCTAARAPVQWEESAKLLDVIDVCAKHRTFVFLSLWLMLSLII